MKESEESLLLGMVARRRRCLCHPAQRPRPICPQGLGWTWPFCVCLISLLGGELGYLIWLVKFGGL